MTLNYVTAWAFAILAEVIKLLFDASAFHFVTLLTVDYLHYFHFILAVLLLYSNCI